MIIDTIIPQHRDDLLGLIIITLSVVCAFQVLFEVIIRILGISAANSVTYTLGVEVFSRLFQAVPSTWRNWSTGDTISRVAEIDKIRNFLGEVSTGAILDAIFIIIALGLITMLSVDIAFFILASLPFQLVVYVIFSKPLRRRLDKEFIAGAVHNNRLVEAVGGYITIKALGAESHVAKSLNYSLNQSLTSFFKSGILETMNEKLLFSIERVLSVIIIYIGMNDVMNGELSLGQLVAIQMLTSRITGPLARFAVVWSAWQALYIARQRLGEIVHADAEGNLNRPLLTKVSGGGRLVFDKISFGYGGRRTLLEQLSLSIGPGGITLITGGSGRGKSTVGRLAAGLETPESGAVLLDGININVLDPTDIRSQILYLPQEPYTMQGSLRENLEIGNEWATDEMLESALRAAGAQEMLHEFEEGLDTLIGVHGRSCSGGERQRIALARMLLRKPRVFILDEPTNALDSTANSVIVDTIQSMSKECTMIIITHSPEIWGNVNQVIDFDRM